MTLFPFLTLIELLESATHAARGNSVIQIWDCNETYTPASFAWLEFHCEYITQLSHLNAAFTAFSLRWMQYTLWEASSREEKGNVKCAFTKMQDPATTKKDSWGPAQSLTMKSTSLIVCFGWEADLRTLLPVVRAKRRRFLSKSN